jgi:glyoxylate utilization-related uncharacterized protein
MAGRNECSGTNGCDLSPAVTTRRYRMLRGTDVLVLVTGGVLALTVQGRSSQLEAGHAGSIPSGATYIVANPARADTTFVPV